MTIKVFGHKAPDTDSTGSPLIWAWYLSEVKGTPAEARLLGAPNTEAAFVLQRWGVETPEIISDVAANESVVVVDTNNTAELPDSINDADILEVIDHHLLAGGLKTTQPINITVRPVACTATIMHDLMGEAAERMPDWVRALMLSCILSDTMELRSPTTTDRDRALAERLARDLEIAIPDYAAEMFAAKSDVSHLSDAELLRSDAKKYEVGDTSLLVSVLETTSPATVLSRKAGLAAAMDSVAAEDGVDAVLFFIIDILSEEATLLVPNDRTRRIAEKSFDATPTDDLVALPGVVSRKKQIVPNLTL